jgi:Tfp pilus assembly protein PilF
VRARVQIMVNDALKNLAGGRLTEAHAQLQQAFEADPSYSQAELWLFICQARVAKADDRQLLAVDYYAKVLKLDPQNREALAAIRAAGTAGEGTTRKLFGKLFGAGKD